MKDSKNNNKNNSQDDEYTLALIKKHQEIDAQISQEEVPTKEDFKELLAQIKMIKSS